jgi:hypothetical protein
MRHYLKPSIAVIILLAAFACASIVWATSRTPAQQAAAKKCYDRFDADVQRCLREHPELSPGDCAKAAAGGWSVCMKNAGLAKEGEHPPKAPIHDRPTSGATTVGTASATPSRLHPTRTNAVLDGANKTATPTPTPNRKPTPPTLNKEKKS